MFLKQSIFLPLFFVILFSNVKAQENNIKADSIPWVRPAIDSVSTDKITLKNDTLHGMQDSLKVKANGIQTTIKYYAVDSIITKISTNTTHLYGDARIEYGTVNLRADQIIIDRNNNELIARGTQDSTGKWTGRPVFKDAQGVFETEKIRYNFVSKRARIKGVATQQSEGHLRGEVIKRNPDNTAYITKGKYIPCPNNPEATTYIQANKIKIIPGKSVITGPFLLHIGGIPTPLGFIFGFFPDTRNATSGILFPKYGDERRRGLFLRDGGWYQVWNDQIHTAVTGDIYSKGSWGLKMRTVYKKRYAYGGHLNITFNRNKTPETDETPMDEKDFWLNWFHRPESLGRNSRFSASVQFGTSTFNQYNLSTVNFSNNVRSSFQSKVDFSGVIPRSPFSYSISARHNQNIQTKVLDVSLPEFSLNMNRVYPAKRSKLDILKRLNVGWGFNTSNRVTNVVRPGSAGFTLANRTVATDTIPVTFGAFNKLMKNATNGAKHRIDMSTSFALLEYLNFTPSFNIEELWYLQELDYEYLPEKNAVRIDTLNGFSRSMTYSTGIGLSTQLYGIFNFIRSRKIQAIRHITTPSVSFSYRPDFSKPRFGYYKNVQVDTTNTGKPIFRQLSIYDGFRFGKPSLGESASMTFSVSNKFEMKVRNDTTTRKVSLLDNLSLNGSYNFLADSFKLSDINIAARTSLFDRKVQVNMGATLDPYSYLPTSLENKKLRRTNAYALRTGQGVGRFTSMRFSLSTNFNSQANNAERSNGRRQTPVNDIDQFGGEASNQFGSLNDGGGTNRAVPEYFYDPNAYVDINIPWNVRLSYDYSYRWTPTNTTTRQSIKAYGQLKLTPKWDITFNSGYDFDRKEFTQTSVGVYRDLGCWDMRANWIPFGAFTSYSIDIQIKSSILKDLKISRRRSQFERRF